LDGLQALLRKEFPHASRKKVNLARYADDFIVTGRTREILQHEVRPLLERFLAERGLELSHDKTVITHIDDGFNFLGQNVRKYNGKMLITPSRESMRSLRVEARKIINNSGSMTAGQMVRRLNPLLRGWAQYHRHVVSSTAFRSLDNYIWHALLRWGRRRHRDRSVNWVLQKYFPRHEGRRYVFTGFVGEPDAPRLMRVYRLDSTPIRRHLLVRGAANPFDPAWESYFKHRSPAGRRMPGPAAPSRPGSRDPSDVSPRTVMVADAEA